MSTQTTTDARFGPVTWAHHNLPTIRLTPARITVVYTILGFSALYLSDALLTTYLNDPLLADVQAIKGGVEVLLTAGLIFGLTHHSHNQLRTATDRIEDARDELHLLHRVLRHNLRNDLNLIQGHANLAQNSDHDQPPTQNCDVILDTVEKMDHYTQHARRIRKVTERSPTHTTIDLSTRLPNIIATHPALTAGVDVHTDIPDDATVYANPLLEDAIEELITNAVTHSTADTPFVDITVTTHDDSVDIAITDNGPGLPQTEYDAIQHITESNVVHSTGLGLWFVDWVATHSDGELTFTHPDDGGTTATLRLPRTSADQVAPTPVFTIG